MVVALALCPGGWGACGCGARWRNDENDYVVCEYDAVGFVRARRVNDVPECLTFA